MTKIRERLEDYYKALDYSVYVSDCFGVRDLILYDRIGTILEERYGFTEADFNRLLTSED